jgi:hypothetical protein
MGGKTSFVSSKVACGDAALAGIGSDTGSGTGMDEATDAPPANALPKRSEPESACPLGSTSILGSVTAGATAAGVPSVCVDLW